MNKKIVFIICLMAITINAYADGVVYSYDNNHLTCSETLSQFEDDGHWDIYAYYNGEQINIKSINFVMGQEATTNTVEADISTIPCNATITCYSDIYQGSSTTALSLSATFIKQCTPQQNNTQQGYFGNITIGNNTNVSSPNFGTGAYNISSNLSGGGITKILGLSLPFALKLFSALVLTIVIMSVRPVHIAMLCFFATLIILTDVLGILTVPATLGVLIMLIILIELVKRGGL